MAKDKKAKEDKPWLFKPGQSGNPSGRPKIPDEVKALREQKSSDIEMCVYKYLSSTVAELEVLVEDKSLPVLDSIVVRDLIRARKNENFGSLEPVLQRSLGKVADRLQVASVTGSYKDMKDSADSLTEEEATRVYMDKMKDVT